MPYIKKANKVNFYTDVYPMSVGELNYVITKICHNYLLTSGDLGYGELKYKNLNEVIGVLECAKQELYRQVVAPYEDIKKKENGNISILDL